jgi:hypothetical protein
MLRHGNISILTLASALLFSPLIISEFVALAAAALAFLVWDILITLDDEIKFIWT